MSDFVDELESELRSAAHRRAAARRLTVATLRRPRPAGVLAAVLAAVAIAVAVAVLPTRDETKPAPQPSRVSPAPAPSRTGSLTILNGTTTAGLATKARQQIRDRVPHRLIPAKGIRIGNAIDQDRERSTVLFLTDHAASARRIAARLGIPDVTTAGQEELASYQAGASIVVLIGHDFLKR